MKVVIVDDEQYARAHLKALLEAQGAEVVGEAPSAVLGIQLAEDLDPDIIFLDIEMPGMSGMQMADIILKLPSAPMIVFVTAYSEHAVSAFDRNALDYLVKPVSDERLAQTLLRARSVERAAMQSAATAVAAAARDTENPLRRLPIRDDYMVRLIKFEDIAYAEAREKRVFVNVGATSFRTYYTLKQLETILPVDLFLRIHDSYIANIAMIEELLFLGNHAYEVRLSTGARLSVGRARYPELQRRLGLA